jgi:hypothetical protein
MSLARPLGFVVVASVVLTAAACGKALTLGPVPGDAPPADGGSTADALTPVEDLDGGGGASEAAADASGCPAGAEVCEHFEQPIKDPPWQTILSRPTSPPSIVAELAPGMGVGGSGAFRLGMTLIADGQSATLQHPLSSAPATLAFQLRFRIEQAVPAGAALEIAALRNTAAPASALVQLQFVGGGDPAIWALDQQGNTASLSLPNALTAFNCVEIVWSEASSPQLAVYVGGTSITGGSEFGDQSYSAPTSVELGFTWEGTGSTSQLGLLYDEVYVTPSRLGCPP